MGFSKNPDGSYDSPHLTNDTNKPTSVYSQTQPRTNRLPDTLPEPTATKALVSNPKSQGGGAGGAVEVEKGYGAVKPKAKGKTKNAALLEPKAPPYRLIITRYSSRLLDADNFAGGCKFLIDAIRRAELITDDNPAAVTMEFHQQKCPRIDERTEIQVYEINL